MANTKRGPGAGKTRRNPFAMLSRVREKPVRKLLVMEGAAPDVATVVYVHGIGNKPVASVLKCQWDTALFCAPMGDRTRLAYWVNRERYPEPEPGTCASKDMPREESAGPGIRALGGIEGGPELDARQRKLMNSLEARMRGGVSAQRPAGPGAKILPLPEGLRRWVTRRVTELFLKDVRDFLFDADQRSLMERSLRERLDASGGPFIVIGHSQGSMIAYHVLRQLQKEQCDVRLFVTIGSPLGIQEVQDGLKKLRPGERLAVPDCVDRWLNVAERLDPVALDADISNDYAASERRVKVENYDDLQINPEWQTNPHSGTGYLSIDKVRQAVRETAGPGFSNLVGRTILMKDLVADLEDGDREQRHSTLIQMPLIYPPSTRMTDPVM